jgi:thiol-disulfide isomerase/thioredoxin
MFDFAAKIANGLPYDAFLDRFATPEQKERWGKFHAAVELSSAQRTLLASFVRRMPVLCLAGTWCGDCVNQCPIFDHFASVNSLIELRFCDRDAEPELAKELSICGGARVPVIVFLSEDGHEVGRYGDRTLAKYRQLVAQLAGAACPTGIVLPERSLIDAVVQDWLDEFERAQWLLRTSARLRQKHGD